MSATDASGGHSKQRRKSYDSESLRNMRSNSAMLDTSSSAAAAEERPTLRRDSSGGDGVPHRPRRNSELSRSASGRMSHDSATGAHPVRPRRNSDLNRSVSEKRRKSSLDELALVDGGTSPEGPTSPVNIGGTAHVGSITINTPGAIPSTSTPAPSAAAPRAVPVPVVVKKQTEPQPPPPEKNRRDNCMDCTKNCFENKMCPSKAGLLEMFTVFIDLTALLFLICANVLPWVRSVPPCTDCPEEFRSGAWLESKGAGIAYGVWISGQMSNSKFLNVSEFFLFMNNTELAATWATQYPNYYFPPGSKTMWTDLSTSNVCAANTPGYLWWGAVYQLCPYGLPSPVMGTQAMLIIGCICAGFSMMFMVAARKGSSILAIVSTGCSFVSFVTTMGAVIWFSTWSYVRSHFDIGQGSLPLRAISPATSTSPPGTIIVPVSASFVWDAGYYFAIFAVICEIFTTLISWIVGTEKWLWAPEDEVVYGPEAWTVDTTYEAPIGFRPTLRQMSTSDMTHQRPMALV